jgi:L-lactate dehydrogenase complex protein LldF
MTGAQDRPAAGSMPAYLGMPAFPAAAREAVTDSQLRRNLTHATTAIRRKRGRVVSELTDWEELRQSAKAIKDHVLANLDTYLIQLEDSVTAAGGRVHWARDADDANAITASLVRQAGADTVVKVKSMATQEIGLNDALAQAGITAVETDLAELIVQLGQDLPSHILVPAIHRNRAEIASLFRSHIPGAPADLSDDPAALAAVARAHLRSVFLSAAVGISGANFAIADTGSLVVVESEGNGRMCLTLPQTLISVVGIEKILPSWRDLEVFLALLPRSSTAERMNPYTTIWSGVTAGDGPRAFHLVLVDNGRTATLADHVGRQALRCIRCSACLNVCPVYERAGGHAYGSPYPGPIGAILTPQLRGMTSAADAALPFASSLCGACYDVCPVAINIPEALVHLRARAVTERSHPAERLVFGAAGWALRSPRRLAAAQRAAAAGSRIVARTGRIRRLPPPLSAWTDTRDAPAPPAESFRAWWTRTRPNSPVTQSAPQASPVTEGEPGDSPGTVPAPGSSPGTEPAPQAGQAQTGQNATAEPAVTTERDEILARIRAAIRPAGARPADPDFGYAEMPRRYQRAHHGSGTDLVALFCDRAADYRATVSRVPEDHLPAAIARALSGLSRFVVPGGLPDEWLADIGGADEIVRDSPPLTAAELDQVAGVVTGCAGAIAETGTVILDHSSGQGRRALTLIPDFHLVVVAARQVAADLPDALAGLNPARPHTLISGP